MEFLDLNSIKGACSTQFDYLYINQIRSTKSQYLTLPKDEDTATTEDDETTRDFVFPDFCDEESDKDDEELLGSVTTKMPANSRSIQIQTEPLMDKETVNSILDTYHERMVKLKERKPSGVSAEVQTEEELIKDLPRPDKDECAVKQGRTECSEDENTDTEDDPLKRVALILRATELRLKAMRSVILASS